MWRVAVRRTITDRPPHRSVPALLTHTVPGLDVLPEIGVVERKANFRVRMATGSFPTLQVRPLDRPHRVFCDKCRFDNLIGT
jgi:hypothetical protein